MKKFKEYVRTRPKNLPITYIGKDHREIDKACQEHNDTTKKSKQLRFKLKEEDEALAQLLHHSNIQHHFENPESSVHIPTFHYGNINLHQKSFYNTHQAPIITSKGPLHFEWAFHDLKDTHFGPVELNSTDQNAIFSYTKGSKGLNQHLISMHAKGKTDDPFMEHEYTEHAKRLMDVASRHQTKADMHLWSGVGSAHPGKHPDGLHLPAFSSMTSTPGVATSFARHDRNIHALDHPHLFGQLDGTHYEPQKTFLIHPSIVRHVYNKLDNDIRPHDAVGMNYYLNKHFHNHPVNQEFFSKGQSKYDTVSHPVKHLLHIHVPAGSHVIHTGGNSDYDSEHELIAPAGSTIKHTGQSPDLHADGIMVHHVTLHTPDFNEVKHPGQMRFKF